MTHRSYKTSRIVAMDQAWVSQLNGQYWPFSLVNSGRPFQEDLRRERNWSQSQGEWKKIHVTFTLKELAPRGVTKKL